MFEAAMVIRDPGALTRVEPGMKLGKYRILRGIARGGMASVWVAKQHGARGFTKLVALKTILPELAADPAFERMLLEEARLAALICHPNVCEIFELIELEGFLALSMEWIDGESLSRMLASSTERLDVRIAARIIAQAAAGLHAAHELRDEAGRPLGLVHRDVSPQNILISRDGHVKLSDFGIAKAMDSQRENTANGHVKGKLAYMSPEQARNDELDRRSDVFSLGVVLYCSVLGRRPFSRPGEASEATLVRLLNVDYERPREVDPRCPAEIAAIIERAMQKDPALRYQSADELRRDLEQWLIASGALTTEHDVGRALNGRCGLKLEQRTSSIRAALDMPLEAHESEPDRVSREGWSSATAAPADTAVAVPRGANARVRRAKLAVRRLLPAVLLVGSSLLVSAAGIGLTGFGKPRPIPSPIAAVRPNASCAAPVLTPPPRPEAAAEQSTTMKEAGRATASGRAAGAASASSLKKALTVFPARSDYRREHARMTAPRSRKPIGPMERDL